MTTARAWVVRKGIVGSGANRCFQTIEVTLKFDAKKQNVIESEAVGGKLITAEEYQALLACCVTRMPRAYVVIVSSVPDPITYDHVARITQHVHHANYHKEISSSCVNPSSPATGK